MEVAILAGAQQNITIHSKHQYVIITLMMFICHNTGVYGMCDNYL